MDERYTLSQLEAEISDWVDAYRRSRSSGFDRLRAEHLIGAIQGTIEGALNIRRGPQAGDETKFADKFKWKMADLYQDARVWELSNTRNAILHKERKVSDSELDQAVTRYINVLEKAKQQDLFGAGLASTSVTRAEARRRQETLTQAGYAAVIAEDVGGATGGVLRFIIGVVSFIIRVAIFVLLVGPTLLALVGSLDRAVGNPESDNFWLLMAGLAVLVNLRLLIFLFTWQFPRTGDGILAIFSAFVLWRGLSLRDEFNFGDALTFPAMVLAFSVTSFLLNTMRIYRAKRRALRLRSSR